MAIREKVWDCAECSTTGILGRHKECPSCGSPREKGEMRSMKGRGSPAVTDPELLRLAKAGADWFCTHCTAGNIGTGDRCSKCAAPRYATAEEDHPDFQGAHKKVMGADERLEREMSQDPRDDAESSDPEPTPRRSSPPPPPRRPTAPPPRDEYVPPPRPWGLIALVATSLVLLIGFIIWAMQTHEVPGSITSMSWTRTVHVENWTDITVRAFRKDTTEKTEIQPRNGTGERAGLTFAGGCRDEYYETVQVECGTKEVCEDKYKTESYSCSKPGPDVQCGETCRDLGNGFEDCSPKYCSGPDVPGTCTRDVFSHKDCQDVVQYCDKRLNESKCDYTTQEWQVGRSYVTTGQGTTALTWESVPLGPLQRATYSTATTRVISYVDDTPKTTDATTSATRTSKSAAEASEKEYLAWTVGEPVILDINNLGGVSGKPRRASVK